MPRGLRLAAHRPALPVRQESQRHRPNPDGSFDVVIGPDKPDDSDANWIATDRARGWLAQ